MTAVGVVVAAPDLALIWCDSATFADGRPSRHTVKISLNPVARLALTGAGWTSLLEGARREAATATSFDELVDRLPSLLRHRAAQLADRRGDVATMTENAVITCGWSASFRRIMAAVMTGQDFFEAAYVDCFTSPHVGDLRASGAASWPDIGAAISQQVAELEHRFKVTLTGTITGAAVAPLEVTAVRLRELGVSIPASSCTTAAVAPTETTRPRFAEINPGGNDEVHVGGD